MSNVTKYMQSRYTLQMTAREMVIPSGKIVDQNGLALMDGAVLVRGEVGALVQRANAAPDLLEACERAAEIIKTARQYFPKSVRKSDKFDLENTNATVTAAIAKATDQE